MSEKLLTLTQFAEARKCRFLLESAADYCPSVLPKTALLCTEDCWRLRSWGRRWRRSAAHMRPCTVEATTSFDESENLELGAHKREKQRALSSRLLRKRREEEKIAVVAEKQLASSASLASDFEAVSSRLRMWGWENERYDATTAVYRNDDRSLFQTCLLELCMLKSWWYQLVGGKLAWFYYYC